MSPFSRAKTKVLSNTVQSPFINLRFAWGKCESDRPDKKPESGITCQSHAHFCPPRVQPVGVLGSECLLRYIASQRKSFVPPAVKYETVAVPKHNKVSWSRPVSRHRLASSLFIYRLQSCRETSCGTVESWISPQIKRIALNLCQRRLNSACRAAAENHGTHFDRSWCSPSAPGARLPHCLCSYLRTTFHVQLLLHLQCLTLADSDGDERTVWVKGSCALSQNQFPCVTRLWQPSCRFNVTLIMAWLYILFKSELFAHVYTFSSWLCSMIILPQ